MSCTITLRADQRKALVRLYRHGADPLVARRAHILLLLADGWPWDTIMAVLFTSPSTIARWQLRFLEGGIEALAGRPLGRRPSLSWQWAGGRAAGRRGPRCRLPGSAAASERWYWGW